MPNERERAEKEERRRWVEVIRRIMQKANMPVAKELHAGDALLVTDRLAKGRRANTLRKHAKTWQRVEGWMLETFGYPWPRRPEEFALFLEARAAEPCGPSVPSAVYRTLIFMEYAAELEETQMIHASSVIKNALEEINLTLAESTGDIRRRASAFPVSVVRAMEKLVVDKEELPYARGLAWYKLVKIWTCCRYSDTTGMPADSVRWSAGGVKGRLERTKTTGPGKRVWSMPVHVSEDAWIDEPRWLFDGLKLWDEMSRAANLRDRDYFLAKPNGNLDGIVPHMARYQDAVQASQMLFGMLRESRGRLVGVKLMEAGAGAQFSEHSERATMRTWAEVAGVPPEVCKKLGRWAASVDDGYMRAQRASVMRAQAHVACFIRGNIGGPGPFDERAVIEAIGVRLMKLGYREEAVKDQMQRLKTFDGSSRARVRRYRWTMLEVQPEEKPPEPEGPPPDYWPDYSVDVVVETESDTEAELGIKPEVVPGGHYVVSIIGRSERKTLHRVGECHRVPGVHYRRYEVVGEDLPEPGLFHQACKACFASRGGAAAPLARAREDSSEGLSVVSSSGSESDGP